jgi:serine/threonine protein kinase
MTQGETISEYVMGSVLGQGQFGVVAAAVHIATGQKVAIKRIRLQR